MRDLPTGIVTLLFTDIEGSTRLLQQLGSRYAEVLGKCRALLRAAFAQWEGCEVDMQGDAFFVAFSRATDAVAAARMIQCSLFTHSWPEGVEVRVRIGLHTGEPEAMGEGYIGLDVHRAARIMSVGYGGQVLLSQTTHNLVEHDLPEGVSLKDLGEYRLKDIAGRCRLYQLSIDGLPAWFPPLKTTSFQHPLSSLPAAPTPFIGRKHEVTAIRDLLCTATIRMVTLIGTAGVGKTRLALQAATQLTAEFPDGVSFVDLVQARNIESFIAAIAQVLHVREETNTSLLERIKTTLHELRILLVLDNFEQVIIANSVLAKLLAHCPNLKILVTSRVMLHIQAERIFDVSPLPLPDLKPLPALSKLLHYPSIDLFVQRAQAVQQVFQLTIANAPAVAGICARLDGIPLAIELAAARSRYFSPQALLAQLEQGLHVLSQRTSDIPTRQQTLHAAIAWSYELLSEDERRVFRRLTICVNGCTLEAAELICIAAGKPAASVAQLLEELIDKSLLRQQGFATGEMRFGILQTLREFGLERLTEAGETEITGAAHSAYYLAWAQKVETLLSGAEQAEWLDRLEQEYENLRTALEWLLKHAESEQQQGEQALQLCIALAAFWEIRGYFREGAAFLERALAVSRNEAASVRAEALHLAGFMALNMDDVQRAETLLHQSQILFRVSGDRAAMANILRMQGELAHARSNYKLATRLLEEAAALYTELRDNRGFTNTREGLAQIAISQCNYSKARRLLEENITYYEAWGRKYRVAYPLYDLARISFLAGRDFSRAETLAQESLALFKKVRSKRLEAYVLCLLAQIYLQDEKTTQLRPLLEEATQTFSDLGDRFGIIVALIIHAQLATYEDNTTLARTLYEQCWELLRTIDAQELSADCLEGLGAVLVRQGIFAWATQLLARAATIRAELVAPIPPVYRLAYEQAVASARAHMQPEDFQSAWAEGRQKQLEHFQFFL